MTRRSDLKSVRQLQDRSSRREEALTSPVQNKVSLVRSATRFMGFLLFLTLLAATPAYPAQVVIGSTNQSSLTIESGGTTNTVIIPARLWKNFTVLMSDLVPPLAVAAARLAGFTLLAGIAGFLTGLILGFGLWFWLRKLGVFDAPYAWYRYFKWLWALLFPVCMALGLAYAAAWFQAGQIAKGAILNDRLMERAIASGYAAVAMDVAKHEIAGGETMAEVQKILQDSEEVAQILSTNLGALLTKHLQVPEVQQALGLTELAWLKNLAESQVGQMVFQKAAANEDTRLVLLTFYAIASGDKSREEYLQGHPKAGPAMALVRQYLQRINRELVRLINGLVYPQVVLAILIGLGVPFGLAGLFRLVARPAAPKSGATVAP